MEKSSLSSPIRKRCHGEWNSLLRLFLNGRNVKRNDFESFCRFFLLKSLSDLLETTRAEKRFHFMISMRKCYFIISCCVIKKKQEEELRNEISVYFNSPLLFLAWICALKVIIFDPWTIKRENFRTLFLYLLPLTKVIKCLKTVSTKVDDANFPLFSTFFLSKVSPEAVFFFLLLFSKAGSERSFFLCYRLAHFKA